MDLQKKQLAAIILIMLKDVYEKTSKLESMFDSSSIHILSRDFDPFTEMLKTLKIPQDKHSLFFDLMKHYVEDQMTIDEILIELGNQMKVEEAK